MPSAAVFTDLGVVEPHVTAQLGSAPHAGPSEFIGPVGVVVVVVVLAGTRGGGIRGGGRACRLCKLSRPLDRQLRRGR